MRWMDRLIEGWYRFVDAVSPFNRGVRQVFRAIARTFRNLWKYVFWFRSVILAAPMAVAAVILAARNMSRLPEEISYTKILFFTENMKKIPRFLRVLFSEEAENVLFDVFVMSQDFLSRNQAVFMPLALTAVCIVLMIFSKRMMYPFLIGLMTLALPIVLYIFTYFPM